MDIMHGLYAFSFLLLLSTMPASAERQTSSERIETYYLQMQKGGSWQEIVLFDPRSPSLAEHRNAAMNTCINKSDLYARRDMKAESHPTVGQVFSF